MKPGAWTLAAVSGPILGTLGMAVPPQAVGGEPTHLPADAPCPAACLWSASLRWENDTFAGTDQFYTDGVGLAVSHTGPSWLDPVANRLPWGEGRRTVSYDFAQAMFTPSDTDLNPPDPNDRPYAGILALGLTLHVEKPQAYHGLKFITGVVGPWSGAEQVQNAVHDLGGGRVFLTYFVDRDDAVAWVKQAGPREPARRPNPPAEASPIR